MSSLNIVDECINTAPLKLSITMHGIALQMLNSSLLHLPEIKKVALMRPGLSFARLPQHCVAHSVQLKEFVQMLWRTLSSIHQQVGKLLEVQSLAEKVTNLVLMLLPTKQTQQADPISASS